MEDKKPVTTTSPEKVEIVQENPASTSGNGAEAGRLIARVGAELIATGSFVIRNSSAPNGSNIGNNGGPMDGAELFATGSFVITNAPAPNGSNVGNNGGPIRRRNPRARLYPTRRRLVVPQNTYGTLPRECNTVVRPEEDAALQKFEKSLNDYSCADVCSCPL